MPASPADRAHPLPAFLEMAVPLELIRLQHKGGPDASDWERTRAFAQPLAEQGDVLLYGGATPGEASRLAGRLARAVAVLAHAPGGIDLFGTHWEAGNGR